jgi:multidrug efflux pump subunit AcrA (membrane-fusion protein)
MSENDDDKPLDPALLRVQARLRRLMLIAGLTLGIGILAVFAAILYRIVASGNGSAPPTPVAGMVSASIPGGARLAGTAIAGNRIVLTYEHAGGTTLILLDAQSLAVIGRLDLKPQ